MKIFGMSLSGFAGILIIVLIIAVLVLGVAALVKYVFKK